MLYYTKAKSSSQCNLPKVNFDKSGFSRMQQRSKCWDNKMVQLQIAYKTVYSREYNHGQKRCNSNISTYYSIIVAVPPFLDMTVQNTSKYLRKEAPTTPIRFLWAYCALTLALRTADGSMALLDLAAMGDCACRGEPLVSDAEMGN